MTGRYALRLLALVPLVAVLIVGTVSALGSRDVDDEFLLRQEHPLRLTTSSVERLVRASAPSPASGHRSNALSADCRPGSRTGLKNPWTCDLAYPGGVRAEYQLTFRSDGSYAGRHEGGAGVVRGCCLDVPGG